MWRTCSRDEPKQSLGHIVVLSVTGIDESATSEQSDVRVQIGANDAPIEAASGGACVDSVAR